MSSELRARHRRTAASPTGPPASAETLKSWLLDLFSSYFSTLSNSPKHITKKKQKQGAGNPATKKCGFRSAARSGVEEAEAKDGGRRQRSTSRSLETASKITGAELQASNIRGAHFDWK